MSASLAETIGSLRADLRRVEITLGTRIDARATANESWLRDEVRREREELFAELDRFREDVARCLDNLRVDIRLLAERVAPAASLPANVEKADYVVERTATEGMEETVGHGETEKRSGDCHLQYSRGHSC